MLAADFYKLIESEFSTVQFLQTHVLPDDTNHSTSTKCYGVTKMWNVFTKETFSNWRSSGIHNSKVRTKRLSIRKKNAFFTFTDLNKQFKL